MILENGLIAEPWMLDPQPEAVPTAQIAEADPPEDGFGFLDDGSLKLAPNGRCCGNCGTELPCKGMAEGSEISGAPRGLGRGASAGAGSRAAPIAGGDTATGVENSESSESSGSEGPQSGGRRSGAQGPQSGGSGRRRDWWTRGLMPDLDKRDLEKLAKALKAAAKKFIDNEKVGKNAGDPANYGKTGLLDRLSLALKGNVSACEDCASFFRGWRQPGDALRHCVWSCCMTYWDGEDYAKKAAEQQEPPDPNDTRGRDMDLHNNAVGRALGHGAKEMGPIMTVPQQPRVCSRCRDLCVLAWYLGWLVYMRHRRVAFAGPDQIRREATYWPPGPPAPPTDPHGDFLKLQRDMGIY